MALLNVSLGGTGLLSHIFCALESLTVWSFPPCILLGMYSVDVLIVDETNAFHYVGLADDGKFLLSARKYRRPSCTEYLISLDARDTSKGNGTYIGKLRSNFVGTKFTVYDAHPPCAGAAVSKGSSAHMIGSAQVSPMKPLPAGNYPVSHISYKVNVLGSRYGKPCDRTLFCQC